MLNIIFIFIYHLFCYKNYFRSIKREGGGWVFYYIFSRILYRKKQTEFDPLPVIQEEHTFFASDNLAPIIYGCIDNIEELRALVEYYIEKEKWEMQQENSNTSIIAQDGKDVNLTKRITRSNSFETRTKSHDLEMFNSR